MHLCSVNWILTHLTIERRIENLRKNKQPLRDNRLRPFLKISAHIKKVISERLEFKERI